MLSIQKLLRTLQNRITGRPSTTPGLLPEYHLPLRYFHRSTGVPEVEKIPEVEKLNIGDIGRSSQAKYL